MTTETELDAVRKKISDVDQQILTLIARRLHLARRAGQIKIAQHQPITAPAIESQIRADNTRFGKTLNLPPKLVDTITSLLISYATRAQVSYDIDYQNQSE